MTVLTSGLGIVCMRNFNNGLRPFVQRGNNKRMDIENNYKKQAHRSWQIDED
jgi:hypothetical protein